MLRKAWNVEMLCTAFSVCVVSYNELQAELHFLGPICLIYTSAMSSRVLIKLHYLPGIYTDIPLIAVSI